MANLDLVFHGLADPTRRAVIEQLTTGPAPVSALAAPHDMALPSFLKHLKVLENGGWIATRKVGRVRTCRLRPDTARAAQGWLAEQQNLWDTRLDRLDAFVEAMDDERTEDDS